MEKEIHDNSQHENTNAVVSSCVLNLQHLYKNNAFFLKYNMKG